MLSQVEFDFSLQCVTVIFSDHTYLLFIISGGPFILLLYHYLNGACQDVVK